MSTSLIHTRIFPAILLIILLLFFVIGPQLLIHRARLHTLHSIVTLEELPLTKQPNGLYTLQILIGGQPFSALVDTGASLSWVRDHQCPSTGGDGCKPASYLPFTSPTHKDLHRGVRKHYKTGEFIKALLSSDHFSFCSATLHVHGVFFGRVVSTNCDQHTQALLGLSPLLYEGGIVDRIRMEKRLLSNTFAWINRSRSGKSVFVFGKSKDSVPGGAATWVKCVSDRWVVPCVIDDHHHVNALIDTAATHLFLPANLYSRIRSVCTMDSNMDLICAKRSLLPNINILLGSSKITIRPDSYTQENGKLLIMPLEHHSSTYSAILGLPFIINCKEIVFDFDDIQIAFIPY